MVMEKLGKDLSKIRKTAQHHKFSLCTVGYLGRQLVDNLRVIHENGLLHRDLKPHNCLLGLDSRRLRLFLVDFGLAKRQMCDGRVIPYQGRVNFRGTAAYASLRAMELADQGWRDDLEGAFYVLADLLLGGLPWRKVSPKPANSTERDQMIKKQKADIIRAIKQVAANGYVTNDIGVKTHLCGPFDANGHPITTQDLKPIEVANALPTEILRFFVDVHDLQYEQRPPYEKLRQYFVQMEERGRHGLLKFYKASDKNNAITLELLGKEFVKNAKFCAQYWMYGLCKKDGKEGREECECTHDITRAPEELLGLRSKKRRRDTRS